MFIILILSLNQCGYRIVRPTPLLRHGIHAFVLDRIENRSGVIGVESPIRRALEQRFQPYIGETSFGERGPCHLYGKPMVFHGHNFKLGFLDKRDADEAHAACQRRKGRSFLVVRLMEIELVPTSFIKGTATGQSLDLQDGALLVSQYLLISNVEIELFDAFPEKEAGFHKGFYKRQYSYRDAFTPSARTSDPSGASLNYLRTQLALVDQVEVISEIISENIFNDLSSIF